MASDPGSECRRPRRGLLLVLSTGALLLCANNALGQPTDADRAVARTRMAEGRARRHAKDLRGALESFRAADSVLHFPTTGLEVARAEEDLGLLVQARETLRRLLDVPETSNELPQFKKARAQAAALIGEIEPSIPTLRITVRGAPMGTLFALAVDGITILPAAVAEPQRMNPGHHVVVATVGWGNAKEEVDLEARDSKEVRISLPAQNGPPAPSAAVAPGASVPRDAVVPRAGATVPPLPLKKDRTLEVVGFGVACVGAIGGSIAGISSIAYTRSAENGCSGGRCPPSTHDDLQTAHTLATVSNVSFIVAGVGVVAGIVGLLQKPKGARAPSAAVVPWLSPGAGGINGTFKF